ncbi:MAG: LON peptidase substrate-binding domain-containing protein [Myxococcaceae bacterium]
MTDGLERVKAAHGRLKVFPLPSAVLFPASVMPLHIFEPRYRELVRDALAGDRIMALGAFSPGWETNYQGRPPLEPLCCAGAIVWHEALEDGRYNILLQGIVRARIVEELPAARLYREVRADLLPDPQFEGPEVELLRNAVLELASDLPQQTAQVLVQQAVRAEGGELADLVAAAVVGQVERRKELLELLPVKERLVAVLGDISDVIARTRVVRPGGPLN